jgi:hypothetical protein
MSEAHVIGRRSVVAGAAAGLATLGFPAYSTP